VSVQARASAVLKGERRWWLALAGVTVVAAVLRLIALSTVPENLFYDAAVRSMTLSLHNFFYGAFDPSAATSIDKPPIDLWLQVIAVKLFGWSSITLKLPEAIAGTAAIPLVYDLVRRIAGPLAALGAAITLALLPTSVVTARSDTMDSVMMLLLLAIAWLLVRSVQRRDGRLLLAAAVLLGLDFNVKLFEALVPVPAFLVFVWLCWRGEPVGARVRRLAAAGALFVAIGLSWMVIVSLTPAHDRPYAIGSTNGSVWNSVFVFDGWDRIFKPVAPRSFSTPSASLPVAHAAAVAPTTVLGASTAPNSPAGAFRLFQYSLVGYGTLIGTLLFAAIVFGLVAMGPMLRRRLRPPPDATREQLIAWAAALAVALWLLSGYLLFSFAGHTQPRYLEAFTPAVAIALGAAIPVVVARARDLFGAYVLIATFGIVMLEGAAETASGKHGYLAIGLSALLAVPVVLYVLLAYAARARTRSWPSWYLPLCTTLGMLGAILTLPAVRDVLLIRDHSHSQAAEVTLPASIVNPIERFLRAHQGATRFEFAATASTIAAPLIVLDHKPVLLLTTVSSRPLVTLAQLKREHAAGRVRYVLNHGGCAPPVTVRPACSQAMQYVRAHARDITALTGLPATDTGLLYDLDQPRVG
jgi:4-amino-4-deoxy-L-arabinose transferase-like glycosyltransferase